MWYGMRLQSLREQSGLSRTDLSLRTGISRSTLAKIESGVNIPSIEQFIRLANSFRLRLPRLLMEVGVIQKKDMAVSLADGPAQALAPLPHKNGARNGARGKT